MRLSYWENKNWFNPARPAEAGSANRLASQPDFAPSFKTPGGYVRQAGTNSQYATRIRCASGVRGLPYTGTMLRRYPFGCKAECTLGNAKPAATKC
jgi:hypothetical protein